MIRRYINKRKMRSLKNSLRYCGEGANIDVGTKLSFAKNIRHEDGIKNRKEVVS